MWLILQIKNYKLSCLQRRCLCFDCWCRKWISYMVQKWSITRKNLFLKTYIECLSICLDDTQHRNQLLINPSKYYLQFFYEKNRVNKHMDCWLGVWSFWAWKVMEIWLRIYWIIFAEWLLLRNLIIFLYFCKIFLIIVTVFVLNSISSVAF